MPLVISPLPILQGFRHDVVMGSFCIFLLGTCLWTWVFGFSDFQIFDSLYIFFCKILSGNMLVGYRGINNKGVLERPWTKWRVLRGISGTLKCQFTGKCWKVDFSMPCTTKSAETLQVAPYGRCGPPGNPSSPWIPFKIMKKAVFVKNPKNPGSLTGA